MEPCQWEDQDQQDESPADPAPSPAAPAPTDAEPATLVVTFDTTSQALAFERACRLAKAPGRLSPIPAQVSAGCGYAWQAPLADRVAVLAAAEAAGCTYESLHELAL
ncbi:MAG: DUF3343 domain-containing protein [Coriobacteriia bacterium]|nr:DUF3343 domain-containing protein [Coriobacteriia bacterium]